MPKQNSANTRLTQPWTKSAAPGFCQSNAPTELQIELDCDARRLGNRSVLRSNRLSYSPRGSVQVTPGPRRACEARSAREEADRKGLRGGREQHSALRPHEGQTLCVPIG